MQTVGTGKTHGARGSEEPEIQDDDVDLLASGQLFDSLLLGRRENTGHSPGAAVERPANAPRLVERRTVAKVGRMEALASIVSRWRRASVMPFGRDRSNSPKATTRTRSR